MLKFSIYRDVLWKSSKLNYFSLYFGSFSRGNVRLFRLKTSNTYVKLNWFCQSAQTIVIHHRKIWVSPCNIYIIEIFFFFMYRWDWERVITYNNGFEDKCIRKEIKRQSIYSEADFFHKNRRLMKDLCCYRTPVFF